MSLYIENDRLLNNYTYYTSNKQLSFFHVLYDDHKKSLDEAINDKVMLKIKIDNLPNSLYKFYKEENRNIDDVENMVLWLSNINDFNDPFELNFKVDNDGYLSSRFYDEIKKLKLIDDRNTSEKFSNTEVIKLRYRHIDGIKYPFSIIYWKIIENKSTFFKLRMDKIIYGIMDELKKKVLIAKENKYRVSSFSKFDLYSLTHALPMWAHYTNNHKGFVVEYDFQGLKKNLNSLTYNEKKTSLGLFPVRYSINIPTMSKTALLKNDKLNNLNLERCLLKSLTTKGKDWRYENEWRLILDTNYTQHFKHKISFPFIKRIYCGFKMSENNIKRFVDICDKFDIELYIFKKSGNVLSPSTFEQYIDDKEFEELIKKRSIQNVD